MSSEGDTAVSFTAHTFDTSGGRPAQSKPLAQSEFDYRTAKSQTDPKLILIQVPTSSGSREADLVLGRAAAARGGRAVSTAGRPAS